MCWDLHFFKVPCLACAHGFFDPHPDHVPLLVSEVRPTVVICHGYEVVEASLHIEVGHQFEKVCLDAQDILYASYHSW